MLSLTNDPNLTLTERIEAEQRRREQGNWVAACNGTETPFTTRTGRRLLYCWQPSTGRHAYLDVNVDLILSDEEARLALATY
jgi:hypothetical protein